MGKQALKSDIHPTDFERRQFLQGSLGLTGVVPLCCRTPEIPPGSASYLGKTLLIDLERAPELGRVGSAAAFVDTARKLDLIVAHIGRNDFAVLDRSCTHNGAQCTYNHRRLTVQCTSLNHAEYDLRGTLLHGRTHGNLRTYAARCHGRSLEIRLGA